uniref:Relaxin receptor 2 n=1 Tax=Phallusia mammillata TaxID=59560 RepID=A0A6F9DRU6_9ASCI|nr:relaxin receptor 2 [Phallusia mammillata]
MSRAILPRPSPTPPSLVPYIVNIIATENTVTSLGNNSNITTTSYVLFGHPPFCSQSVSTVCQNVTLNRCKDCSMVGAGLFCLAVVILGLAIVTANSLVVWLFLTGKSTFTGSYGKIKMSLAIADLMTGIQIFFVVLPHFNWTINSTYQQIFDRTISFQNSPNAAVGGVFYLFIFTSSLYHLVFLALQRFCAIKWPIMYQQQDSKKVYAGLAGVWVIAFVSAVSPTWFPQSLAFGYQHIIFMFYLSQPSTGRNGSFIPLILVMLCIYIFPFLLMNSFTIAARYYMMRYNKKSAALRSNENTRKRDNMVFVTMATMQMAYVVTAMPLLIVIIMSYSSALDNNTVSIPFVVGFYLSMSNSFVNVIIYSVMDKKFRNAVKDLCVNNRVMRFVTRHRKNTTSIEQLDKDIRSRNTPKSDQHPSTSV